jgi:hypothetical protein
MRFARLLFFLFVVILLAGISLAQEQKDTNFDAGPQYLVTSGSSIFLRPIATPSLTLGSTLEAQPANPVTETSTEIPATALAQAPDLTRVYYGGPVEPAPEVSEIEISSARVPTALPESIMQASIMDVGVGAIVDSQSLRERGYGMNLGEVAAFWKEHKLHAPRVYTNADITRLAGS